MPIDISRTFLPGESRRSTVVPHWSPAQSYGIQLDAQRRVWHAGHVSAIVSDGTHVVAGTHTGGAWLISPSIQPSYRDGYRGVTLSDDWITPDISALAYGPAGTTEVFVGCANGDTLFLIELQAVVGDVVPKATTRIPLPAPCTVFGIAILGSLPAAAHEGAIVLATSAGVWWSNLPRPTHDPLGYSWRQARGLTALGAYSGIAPAGWTGGGRFARETQNVVVAAHGGTAAGQGIFLGTFQGGDLVFAPPPGGIQGAPVAAMRRTTLASCAADPQRIYAIAAQDDQTFLAGLKSTDGGSSWTATTDPDPTRNCSGAQGDWNQCLAVAQTSPDLVAFGWRAGGVFFSVDGGARWQHPTTDDAKCGATAVADLHGDLHALYFARTANGDNILFIGGDGGLVSTTDHASAGAGNSTLCQTYNSQYSRPLRNLQIYGIGARFQSGSSYVSSVTAGSTLTASHRFPGLLACGTQDNGNLFLAPRQEGGSAWQPLGQPVSDGGVCALVDVLGAVLAVSNVASAASVAYWDDAHQQFGPLAVLPADGNAAGIGPSAMVAVAAAQWRARGLFCACAGTSAGNVYGLYFKGKIAGFGPGPALEWQLLGNVGSWVTGLGCLDGDTIFVGTSDGRIVRMQEANGSMADEPLPASVSPMIVSRIEAVHENRPFVIDDEIVHALDGGTIIRRRRGQWRSLPGSNWQTFAYDAETERLFAADEATAFELADADNRWTPVNAGLPAFVHATNLQLAPNARGGTDLFLSTYGRSLWRAEVTLPEPSGGAPRVPQEASEVLLGVIADGGGLVRIGSEIHPIPAGPLATDLLAGLVIYGIAEHMSAEGRQAIQRSAIEQIATMLWRQLGRNVPPGT